MERSNSRVSVILPTFNEERNVGSTLRQLECVLDDPFLLVVDGNSVDRTAKIAEELGAEVVLQDGSGKGAGLRQAFQHCGLNGEFVVMIDADGSMDPKEVPLFVRALESGADVVKGSRFLPGGYSEDLSLVRRVGNKILVSLVNLMWSTNYTDLCYGFMAFRREALSSISPLLRSQNFEIEAEICIKTKKLGLKVVEVPSVEDQRKHGESNLNTFRDGFRIFRKILGELFNRD